jgi:hypothetical protein
LTVHRRAAIGKFPAARQAGVGVFAAEGFGENLPANTGACDGAADRATRLSSRGDWPMIQVPALR